MNTNILLFVQFRIDHLFATDFHQFMYYPHYKTKPRKADMPKGLPLQRLYSGSRKRGLKEWSLRRRMRRGMRSSRKAVNCPRARCCVWLRQSAYLRSTFRRPGTRDREYCGNRCDSDPRTSAQCSPYTPFHHTGVWARTLRRSWRSRCWHR